MWISSVRAGDALDGVILISILITLGECKSVSEFFDRVAVQINFEFVNSLRMVGRRRDGSENGMANIDCERCACLSAEYVQVCDVEAYVLACDGRIQVMRHGAPAFSAMS
jgi:hypothetical protein